MKKLFTTHLSDARINAGVLDIHPVPVNNFLNPSKVDAYFEDLVNDKRALKFLKLQDRLLNMCRENFLDVCWPRFGKNWMEPKMGTN